MKSLNMRNLQNGLQRSRLQSQMTLSTLPQPIFIFVNDNHAPTPARYKAPRTRLISRKRIQRQHSISKFSLHFAISILTSISLQDKQRLN